MENTSSKTSNIASNEYENHAENMQIRQKKINNYSSRHTDGPRIGEILNRPAKVFLDTGATINVISHKELISIRPGVRVIE